MLQIPATILKKKKKKFDTQFRVQISRRYRLPDLEGLLPLKKEAKALSMDVDDEVLRGWPGRCNC